MRAVVWTKKDCLPCGKAKTLLRGRGVPFEERRIGSGWTKEQLLEAVPGAKTVPQIFLNGRHVGGYDELKECMG